ncbi:hypothetical protein lerEdw1_002392 [Lerista edwardsae]|nr:hypothetical protein lerEdw1_002392 [Lerista edwardsae]
MNPVITSQPGVVVVQAQNGQWQTELCDCFSDCGVCICGTFFPLCLGCQVASDMDECCLCGHTIGMRAIYRTRYGIPVLTAFLSNRDPSLEIVFLSGVALIVPFASSKETSIKGKKWGSSKKICLRSAAVCPSVSYALKLNHCPPLPSQSPHNTKFLGKKKDKWGGLATNCQVGKPRIAPYDLLVEYCVSFGCWKCAWKSAWKSKRRSHTRTVHCLND